MLNGSPRWPIRRISSLSHHTLNAKFQPSTPRFQMSTQANYVIAPPPQAVPAVAGTDRLFPVRRLWCVGRNYVEHIKEMGQDVREPPFFFAKPADAIVPDGGTVPYPSLTKDMHHEVELVVALKSGGPQRPGRQGDRLHLRIRRRHRSDATRSAYRLARHQAAVGDRQGVRSFRPCGALRPASGRSATRQKAASC